MKRIFIWMLTGFFLLSAICLDVSAAKKAGKLSKEANPGDGAHWQISTTKKVAKRIREKSDELASK